VRPVSPELAAALSTSHGLVRTVSVHDCSTDALLLGAVPIEGGTLSQNLSDAYGWSASLTVADPTLLPTSPADPLSGFASTYLQLSLGAVTDQGPQTVPMVRLLPARVALSRDSGGSYTFTIDAISGAAFAATDRGLFAAVPGETVQQAVSRLVDYAMPWPITVTDSTAPRPLDPLWSYEGDAWTAARALCEGINLVCELDANRLTIREPFTVGAPDVEWSTTEQVLSVDTETGRGGTFANRVRVTFDTPSGPVVGDAVQSAGALAYGGPAGRVTLDLSRPGPADEVDAQLFAVDLLRTTAAAWRTVGLSAVPDPRLQCGDTLRIVTPTGTADHLVTFTEWDLGTGPMAVGVRTSDAGV